FREAYREVAASVQNGSYKAEGSATYTHLGSIGNHGLDRIQQKMKIASEVIYVQPADELFERLKAYY
ncbi:argininosuccinate lyase, partial [Bacteroidota bacterium]